MRYVSGVTDQFLYFVAVDATDLKTRETGMTVGNLSCYRSRDGGTATIFTTPTFAEVDATNMPGVYTLLLDEDMSLAAGNDSEEMTFHIKESGGVMAPVTRSIELYRAKITAGNTLGVESDGDVTKVNLVATTTANTDMRGTDSAALASLVTAARMGALDDWINAGRLDAILDIIAADVVNIDGAAMRGTDSALTDKAGFSLSTAGILAIWHQLTSAIVTVGSIGKLLKDNIDAVISAIPTTAMRGTDGVDTSTMRGTDGAYTGGNITGNLSGSVGSVTATVSADLISILGTALTETAGQIAAAFKKFFDIGTPASTMDQIVLVDTVTAVDTLATDALDAAALSTDAAQEIADQLLDRTAGVETGLTVRQWLRLGAAALFSKASGLDTTTAVYRDFGDAKARITATVDADGNRTAVTTDAT